MRPRRFTGRAATLRPAVASAADYTFAFVKRHAVTLERAAALIGLSAIAIAQPTFEVVSNSPEFFAARGTTLATAVIAVFAIFFGVPLALLVIERALRCLSPGAAALFFGASVAVLSAAAAMPSLKQIDALAFPWNAVMAVGAGITAAVVYARSRIAREFLTLLGVSALAVPALVLADPAMKQILRPVETAMSAQTVERTPPIVFVIFDELPLNSLMTAEGAIDAGRYPNFAALARESHWYRNATTVASNTSHAVPAILSGRYPTQANDVPTLQYYPVNLFTTLTPHYEISTSFRFKGLCPPRACHDAGADADTVASLLSDLRIVWLHIVLPEPIADTLPPVTEDWAQFARDDATLSPEIRDGRKGLFEHFVSSIDGRPAFVHFMHSMLPHMALEYVPSGRRYRRPDYDTLIFRRGRLFEHSSPAYADSVHQRHLAQVGFVDHLLGRLLARLREVGAYDSALVIITADHGASYREGRSRRVPQARNLSEILRVPLLIKLPGQRHGVVDDRIVETVDILPTILDIVGARTQVRFDGRSLVDMRVPERTSRTFIWRNRQDVAVRAIGDLSAQAAESLERRDSRFGRGDSAGLYAPPDSRHLLGASQSALHAASGVRVSIRGGGQFQDVNLAADPLPLYVGGLLDTKRPAPLAIAVVVNGVVAAVTQSYRERAAHRFGTLIPETSLRNGRNVVAGVALDEPSAR